MRRRPMHRVLAIWGCLGISFLQVASRAVADTVHVAADATILEGSTQNLGLATTVDVANVTAGASRMGLVRFDLGTVPAGSPIAGAWLRVWVSNVAQAGSFKILPVLSTWSERTVIWPGPTLDSTVLASKSVVSTDKGNYLLFNLTAMVESWLDGTLANHGIALVASSPGPVSIQIDSKEATATSHPMELEIVLGAADPECVDGDADGFFGQAACGTVLDCNDNLAAARPGALEICADSIDNNCDGRVDDGCTLNLPPVVSAGPDQSVSTGATVQLAGSGTDPEGAPLTFAWTQVLGPNVGPLSGPQPAFTAPGTAGTLSFDLVVSDGVHNSTPDRVSVAVSSCASAQDVPDPLFIDSNCDGIDGDIARAVFVSVSGNDSNPGTMAQPVATVAQGIVLAGTTKNVYVSKGIYSVGQLQLASGVSLYGLFDASTGWSRAAGNVTRLAGGTTALLAQTLTSETYVEGFEIVAASATGASESSYGVRVLNGTGRLVLRGNTIQAGSGGNGAAGSAGASGQNGGNGGAGMTGCDGCSSGGAGGFAGSSACGRFGGSGGAGGYDAQGTNGQSASGGALGGNGGARSSSCGSEGGIGGPGQAGVNGSSGFSGAAAPVFGSAVSGLYVPASGGHGASGTSGQGGSGGGGGGGGRESTFVCSADRAGGGGGGGAGGCAGGGGNAGQGGGGSYAVFVVASPVTLENNVLISGSGGTGGTGGSGGSGGSGGLQGPGGSGPGDGGNGGTGGRGGNGGAGGGGAGGPGGASLGVLYFGEAPVLSGNTFTLGIGGAGGPGGSGAPAGPQGPSQDVVTP